MLQLKDKKEFTKLLPDQTVDVLHMRALRRKSSASLMVKKEQEKATIDIVVRQSTIILHAE